MADDTQPDNVPPRTQDTSDSPVPGNPPSHLPHPSAHPGYAAHPQHARPPSSYYEQPRSYPSPYHHPPQHFAPPGPYGARPPFSYCDRVAAFGHPSQAPPNYPRFQPPTGLPSGPILPSYSQPHYLEQHYPSPSEMASRSYAPPQHYMGGMYGMPRPPPHYMDMNYTPQAYSGYQYQQQQPAQPPGSSAAAYAAHRAALAAMRNGSVSSHGSHRGESPLLTTASTAPGGGVSAAAGSNTANANQTIVLDASDEEEAGENGDGATSAARLAFEVHHQQRQNRQEYQLQHMQRQQQQQQQDQQQKQQKRKKRKTSEKTTKKGKRTATPLFDSIQDVSGVVPAIRVRKTSVNSDAVNIHVHETLFTMDDSLPETDMERVNYEQFSLTFIAEGESLTFDSFAMNPYFQISTRCLVLVLCKLMNTTPKDVYSTIPGAEAVSTWEECNAWTQARKGNARGVQLAGMMLMCWYERHRRKLGFPPLPEAAIALRRAYASREPSSRTSGKQQGKKDKKTATKTVSKVDPLEILTALVPIRRANQLLASACSSDFSESQLGQLGCSNTPQSLCDLMVCLVHSFSASALLIRYLVLAISLHKKLSIQDLSELIDSEGVTSEDLLNWLIMGHLHKSATAKAGEALLAWCQRVVSEDATYLKLSGEFMTIGPAGVDNHMGGLVRTSVLDPGPPPFAPLPVSSENVCVGEGRAVKKVGQRPPEAVSSDTITYRYVRPKRRAVQPSITNAGDYTNSNKGDGTSSRTVPGSLGISASSKGHVPGRSLKANKSTWPSAAASLPVAFHNIVTRQPTTANAQYINDTVSSSGSSAHDTKADIVCTKATSAANGITAGHGDHILVHGSTDGNDTLKTGTAMNDSETPKDSKARAVLKPKAKGINQKFADDDDIIDMEMTPEVSKLKSKTRETNKKSTDAIQDVEDESTSERVFRARVVAARARVAKEARLRQLSDTTAAVAVVGIDDNISEKAVAAADNDLDGCGAAASHGAFYSVTDKNLKNKNLKHILKKTSVKNINKNYENRLEIDSSCAKTSGEKVSGTGGDINVPTTSTDVFDRGGNDKPAPIVVATIVPISSAKVTGATPTAVATEIGINELTENPVGVADVRS